MYIYAARNTAYKQLKKCLIVAISREFVHIYVLRTSYIPLFVAQKQ